MALPTKTDLSTLVLPGVKPVEYFKIANVFQDEFDALPSEFQVHYDNSSAASDVYKRQSWNGSNGENTDHIIGIRKIRDILNTLLVAATLQFCLTVQSCLNSCFYMTGNTAATLSLPLNCFMKKQEKSLK